MTNRLRIVLIAALMAISIAGYRLTPSRLMWLWGRSPAENGRCP